MIDRPLHDAFERAVRATLEDLAPAAAPTSLHAAVAAVPHRPRRALAGPRRALFSVAGIAAAIVLAVAGLGIASGVRLPTAGVPPVETPSSASLSVASNTFTFRVVPANGSTASKTQISAVSDAMASRLAAYGIGTFSSSASDDRITMKVPGSLDDSSRRAIRQLLGATGTFFIGQPVSAPPAQIDHVTDPPLLARDDITGVTVVSDQTGNPALDLTLSDQAAAAFADATRAHVGDYLPIVLDGVAISVPVIQDAITNGEVQIEFANGDATSAAALQAILLGGPLPFPVAEVTP